MAAPTRTPRRQWIDAGLRTLADGGPDAVRVEVLAKALGVTKGGFYGHFDNRQALLDEVLDAWEQASTDDVRERVEAEGGDARVKLLKAGALTFSETLRPVDSAVRDWARREPAVAERLRRVDDERMDYLRALFGTFCADADDVEARSTLALALMVGSHTMAAGHGDRSRAEALELAARLLVSQADGVTWEHSGMAPDATSADDPSATIDAIIARSGDWRGDMLSHLRDLIRQAEPDVVEEIKWRKPSNPLGVPVWSRDGIICTGETYKDKVKLTFAQGASLEDPKGVFNASLDAGTRRAIDVREGEEVDAKAFKALVRAAAERNAAR